MDESEILDEPVVAPVKRGRGRPKGVRNKRPEERFAVPAAQVAPSVLPYEDYTAPDPMALVGRLYAEVDWGMTALRNMMKTGIGAAKGMNVSYEDTEKLAKVSAALCNALVAHDRAIKLMDKLKEAKTPAELLEIAVKKIEGQDLATMSAIIKRLRDKRKSIAPMTGADNTRIANTSMEDSMEEAMKDL
jgi:hypothetical protein